MALIGAAMAKFRVSNHCIGIEKFYDDQQWRSLCSNGKSRCGDAWALIVQSSNDKQSKAAEMQDNVNAMKGKATA